MKAKIFRYDSAQTTDIISTFVASKAHIVLVKERKSIGRCIHDKSRILFTECFFFSFGSTSCFYFFNYFVVVDIIHFYIDYMGIYLLNGWLPVERIGAFTLIFIAAFAVIWLIIYLSIRMKVNRINQKMQA